VVKTEAVVAPDQATQDAINELRLGSAFLPNSVSTLQSTVVDEELVLPARSERPAAPVGSTLATDSLFALSAESDLSSDEPADLDQIVALLSAPGVDTLDAALALVTQS
jgi:hypothetical protein